MSSRFNPVKLEEAILNIVCLVMAAGFIALALGNFGWAGDFMTIDSLFTAVVMLMLAGLFLISPLHWAYTRGYLKMPFAAPAEGAAVDTTPIHFEGSTKLFLSILGWLLALTLIEVFLAYIHTPLHIMLTILMGLSLIKAALIMAYFMHLRFERLSLVITLVPMLVICICLLFVFFPDSMRSYGLRYRFNDTKAASETK